MTGVGVSVIGDESTDSVVGVPASEGVAVTGVGVSVIDAGGTGSVVGVAGTGIVTGDSIITVVSVSMSSVVAGKRLEKC